MAGEHRRSLWERFKEFNAGRSQVAGIGLVVLAIFAIGLVANNIASSTSSSDTVSPNEPEESLPQLSIEEEDYLDERISINDEAIALVNEQIDLFEECPDFCESVHEDKLSNVEEMAPLGDEAESMTPPSGYEESHEAFMDMLIIFGMQVNSIAVPSTQETISEINSWTDEANAYGGESVELLPPDAREYYVNAPG